MNNLYYPWLIKVFSQFEGKSVPAHHALLLTGPPGIGKDAFATTLAQGLLCESASPISPCGSCPGCRWFAQDHHPDFRRVSPAAESGDEAESAEPAAKATRASREIRIDQIRALAGFVELAAHRGGSKVVLITPADAMNTAAANALLKTLEEPPAGTRFLLVTARPAQLPATIRSRCQVVALSAPEPQQALGWLCEQSDATQEAAADALAAAGGAPRIALELLQADHQSVLKATLDTFASLPETSAMDAAAGLSSLDPVQWIHPLQCWLSDLARVASGGVARFFPSRRKRYEQLAPRVQLDDLLGFELWLRQLRRLAHHPLNARLLVEDALMRYVHALARA